MTLIAGWIACDQRGPCSAYIASDSRISNGINHYDNSQKVFALKNTPDILGYCGEVLFTNQAIARLVSTCDEGKILSPDMECEERGNLLFRELSAAHNNYTLNNAEISIYYIGRNKDKVFQAYKYQWEKYLGWKIIDIDTKMNKSRLIFCDGSGKNEFNSKYIKLFRNGNNESTSRNYFHCFCDTLNDIKDQYCGGVVQLAGLYNGEKFNGMYHGIILNSHRYYKGSEVLSDIGFDKIRWYNYNFEICNYKTLKIEEGAMRQPISKKATP